MKRTCRAMTDVQKKTISKTMLAKKIIRSEETRKKMSDSRKGRKLSPEHIESIKQGLKKYWSNIPE